jgi:hypothetical protein
MLLTTSDLTEHEKWMILLGNVDSTAKLWSPPALRVRIGDAEGAHFAETRLLNRLCQELIEVEAAAA